MAAPRPVILRVKVDLEDEKAISDAIALSKKLQSTLGDVKININAKAAKKEVEQVTTAVKRSDRTFKGFTRGIQAGAIALTGYASALFIIAQALRAATRFAGQSITTFAEFDRVVTTVGVVSGASAEELNSLRESAELLGRSTEFTTTQVAELQLVLSRAGFRSEEIEQLSSAILDLATVSGEAPAAAAGGLASVIRTFNLDAADSTDVLDVLTTGFNESRLQLEFFTTAFGFVGPVAAEAGLEVRDLTAILGFLADRGLRASTAGTALRQLLIDLQTPASKAAQALGFTVNNAEGLFIALRTLNERGINTADVFRKTAVPAINALRSEVDSGRLSIEDFRDLLEDVEGASSDAAETIRDTLAGDIAELAAAFEAVKIVLSDINEGPLRAFTQGLTEAFRQISALLRDSEAAGLLSGVRSAQQGIRIRGAIRSQLGFLGIAPLSERDVLTAEALEFEERLLVALRDNNKELDDFIEFINEAGIQYNELVTTIEEGSQAGARVVTEFGRQVINEYIELLGRIPRPLTEQGDPTDPTTDIPPTSGLGPGDRAANRRPRFSQRVSAAELENLKAIEELEQDRNDLLRERVRLENLTGEEAEEALAKNQLALKVVDAALKLEQRGLAVQREIGKITDLREERDARALFLQEAAPKLTEEEIKAEEDKIQKLDNEIAIRENQLRLADEILERLQLELDLANARLGVVRETNKEEEEGENRRRRRRRPDRFNRPSRFLARDPLPEIVNAFGTIDELVRRSEEGVLTTADKIIGSFGIINSVIQDSLQLTIEASERRIQATEREFDARIEAAEGFSQVQARLEEERDKRVAEERERQARLAKAQAIFNISLSGAQAIVSALAAPFGSAVLVPLISGIVAAQLAVVASTPIPQFAEGGLLVGKPHSDGGIKMNVGGRMVEAEHGEWMDRDEFGNPVIINKRSAAAFSRQLRAMQGQTFAGKQGILSAINAKYGRAFDSLPSYFQQGGVVAERQSQLSGLRLDLDELTRAIYSGALEGTSEGVRAVDTNRRRERDRITRAEGNRSGRSSRRVFGLDGTFDVPVRPGTPERIG